MGRRKHPESGSESDVPAVGAPQLLASASPQADVENALQNPSEQQAQGKRPGGTRNKIGMFGIAASPTRGQAPMKFSSRAPSPARAASVRSTTPPPRASKDSHVTLHLERGRGKDESLQVAVLRQLIGAEMRNMLRQELNQAFAEAQAGRPLPATKAAVSGSKITEEGLAAELLRSSVDDDRASTDGQETNLNRIKDHLLSRLTITDLDEHINDEQEDPSGSRVLSDMGIVEKKPFVGVIADSLPWGRGLFMKIVRCASGIGVAEAPQRRDRVSRFMRTNLWTFLVYTVIITNCAFMAYATNEAVQRYEDGPSNFVITGEFVFMALFSVEMVLRLWRDRLYYFYDVNFHFNWLDLFVLVIMYYFNLVSDQIPNVAWLRILRMLRLVKVLRVFRLIIVFKTLRAILLSLATTVGTFFWSMLLLTIVFFVFALVFVQGVAIYFRDEGSSLAPDVFTRLNDTYGSIDKAMISLYMCTTGGLDWSICYDPMALTGKVNQVLFLVFIAFTQIAVLNIILGIFVDNAMKRMMIEKEEAAYEHAVEELHSEMALRQLCMDIDSDKDGRITEKELGTVSVTSYLDLMGFHMHNVMEYFRVLSRGTKDAVDINLFVRGCMRLKGSASCYDMQILRCEVQEVYATLSEHKQMSKQLLSELARLQRAVDARDAGN